MVALPAHRDIPAPSHFGKLELTARRSLAILLTGALGFALLQYPMARFELSIGLLLYGLLLFFYPRSWLVVIPALLPILDFAPWTGWFFFDEFDFFIVATLVIALWRERDGINSSRLPKPFLFIVIFLTLSYSVSLLIGLSPLDPLDSNAFSNYYSRYHSLRVAKGLIWACALLPCLQSSALDSDLCKRRFTWGMLLGLAGLCLAVARERFLFAGLYNFNNAFRTTATFSGLHNGGNDIEAYLVFASPFILAWVLFLRGRSAYIAGFFLFTLSTYSLFVTFSRGGYLGFLVTWLVLLICLLFSPRRYRLTSFRAPLLSAVFIVLGAAIAIPIFKGDFIQARFASVSRDWESRLTQLKVTFQMMDEDLWTSLFGMGLGRFPAIYFIKQPPALRPATYSYQKEGDNLYLRLQSGSPLYVGQRIGVVPHRDYTLSLDLRSTAKNAVLRVPLCEKSLQQSFRCHWFEFRMSVLGRWEHQERKFNMRDVGDDLGRTGGFSRRPVELALYNPVRGATIDVDNVRLIDEAGTDLIANGDFSHGHDRWFFTVDNFIPWQSSNHWAQIFFEQGWFGLLAFNFLIAYALIRLLLQARQGDLFSAVLLASATGFLTVGLFGSLFDTPRMATLFYLSLFLAVPSRRTPAGTARGERHYASGLQMANPKPQI